MLNICKLNSKHRILDMQYCCILSKHYIPFYAWVKKQKKVFGIVMENSKHGSAPRSSGAQDQEISLFREKERMR